MRRLAGLYRSINNVPMFVSGWLIPRRSENYNKDSMIQSQRKISSKLTKRWNHQVVSTWISHDVNNFEWKPQITGFPLSRVAFILARIIIVVKPLLSIIVLIRCTSFTEQYFTIVFTEWLQYVLTYWVYQIIKIQWNYINTATTGKCIAFLENLGFFPTLI